MNRSYVYRRAMMRSLALLLAVSLLAVALVSLPVFHSTAQHAPHVAHVAAQPHAPIRGSVKRYQSDGELADGSIPSWDIMTLYVTVRCFS
jgi:hypothetical protein